MLAWAPVLAQHIEVAEFDGLNINEEQIPEEINHIASSLKIENNNSIQREPLLAFILNEFEKLYNKNPSVWVSEWKKYCNHINKNICFHKGSDLIERCFIDIGNNGEAIINANSEEIIISTGELELL